MVRLFGREDRRREQLLSAYVDGEVTAEEAREVEELLASSGDARRELAELQATVDLVRGLPELALPRSFALDAAPKKGWTLWWPSVRMTGLATSVATMLLVGLVAGDMLDVLEQARFGGDDSAEMYDFASDDSTFAAAAPAAAPESAAAAAMDAPTSPEPEAAVMKSVASQDESVPVPAAPAAAAPRMAKVESSDEPAAAMQQDTTEEAPQASEVESREEPLVAMQQDMTEEAPQADAAQSSEEPPVTKQHAITQDEPVTAEESQVDEVFDDPEGDRITLPLVELQIGAALVAVALGGATLVAVRRRRSSVL
jgi:hypothetical protein